MSESSNILVPQSGSKFLYPKNLAHKSLALCQCSYSKAQVIWSTYQLLGLSSLHNTHANEYNIIITEQKMEYEALKDSWSEVEDRDGIRLSWNTFPSSRMVL